MHSPAGDLTKSPRPEGGFGFALGAPRSRWGRDRRREINDKHSASLPPALTGGVHGGVGRLPLERRQGFFRRRDGDEAEDRRRHAPRPKKGWDGCSERQAKYGQNSHASLISATTGGPTPGPIPVKSAVRFWQKFLPAAIAGGEQPYSTLQSAQTSLPAAQSSRFNVNPVLTHLY